MEPQSSRPRYTLDHQKVIEAETDYIRARRKFYDEERPDDYAGKPGDRWGLCISGGGIRSATLGLGMLQKLVVEGLLKKFDYLSTVSGGGYIGSCLTSLMNTDPEKFFQPDPGKTSAPGMSIDTSPFVKLIEREKIEIIKKEPGQQPPAPIQSQASRWMPSQMVADQDRDTPRDPEALVMDYREPEKTKIDVRHQIHHLRTHGEYLTRDRLGLSADIQRMIGIAIAGIINNVVLFLLALTVFVAANFIAFQWLSDLHFYDQMAYRVEYEMLAQDRIADTEQIKSLSNYWNFGLKKWLGAITAEGVENWGATAFLALLGVIMGLVYVLQGRRLSLIINHQRQQEASGAKQPEGPAGSNTETRLENPFIARFNLFSLLGAPLLSLAAWAVLSRLELGVTRDDYWLVFILPVAFALGLFLIIYTLAPYLEQGKKGSTRYRRAILSALRGGAAISLIINVIMPVFFLLLFSLSYFFQDLAFGVSSGLTSIISLLVGYGAMSGGGEGQGKGVSSKIFKALQRPILTLSILVFVIFTASLIARLLGEVSANGVGPAWIILLGATIVLLVLGFTVNANRLSLHYFYRDRLTEAFLKTDARVKRPQTGERQGRPLVNLRNDEDLKLQDIGWLELAGEELTDALQNKSGDPDYRIDPGKKKAWKRNVRSPYHIVVTALNLQGSKELVRKDLMSDHFIFSPLYVGSNTTGYVSTDRYDNGRTKLARAMAISAAAVSSAIGFGTFFAQSFLTTLFNLRLGYWVENPWLHREGAIAKRRATFWPFYLLIEMLGLSRADRHLVNLSDGAHTGDNLAMLPLLRRRCKMLVVCDFEQDNEFTFASLTHAIRMANIEENTEINIDLRPIVPKKKGAEIGYSLASVAVGEIRYPDNQIGTLVYIKSSVNANKLPASIFNYHNMHPDFPHQSTGDQYFDDMQFEAYRELGFTMAGEAADKIRRIVNPR